MDALRIAEPSFAERTTGEIFARSLGLVPPRGGIYGKPEDDSDWRTFSTLLTPSGLASLGVDVGGAAVIVPSTTDGAVVVGFDLLNRVRFEAWLAQLAGGATRRISIGGEQASVLEPAGDTPITCLSRRAVAYCQLGASAGADPIALLRSIVVLAQPSLAASPAIVRSFERLPDNARAYAVVSSDAVARVAVELATARAQRDHRFDDPESKKRAEQEASAFAQRLRKAADIIDGAAVGLYSRRDAIALRAEVAINERGTRVLHELSPSEATSETIARWSETPALARILVRTKGSNAERMLSALGLQLPPGSLSGTFAVLLLGVDAACPLAKQSREESALGWAFLLPSALALGLEREGSADEVHRAMQRFASGGATPSAKEEPHASSSAGAEPALEASRAPITGHAYGSSYDIRVLDDLVLAGTGPGSGAAAMRRLGSLPPRPRDQSREAPPLLEGSIHLRAIDAAFGAGDFAREGRRELRVIDLIRMRVRPLLDQIEGVNLEVRAMEQERRVRVDLAVAR